MKNLRYLLLLILCALAFHSSAQLNKNAAEAFIKRVIPTVASKFVVEEIPAENGKDVFELQSEKGKVVLRGNKALSIASALGYYLKIYCRDDFGWNGNNMHLPATLPVVGKKVHHVTFY